MSESLVKISPHELLSLFESGEEFALLDPLEEGEFAVTPHLIQATNIPLSCLEIRIGTLVPQRATKIILTHDRVGLAQRAAKTLKGMGYSNICLLEATSGLELYTGFNVKSKAFGEIVEHHYATPTQDVETVKDKIEKGLCILIDVRPYREFNYETIPGAYNVTGPELYDVARRLKVSPGQEVIVNCGGRTRSILGAQSLIEMGVDYPVSSLKNGTMGWHLSGYALEYGASRGAGDLALFARTGQSSFEENALQEASFEAIKEGMASGRTVYFFDLRDQAEASHLPLPYARFASGVQLIQATDSFCAVQNATVVLIDPSRLRAVLVGGWLRRMGVRRCLMISENIDQWLGISSPTKTTFTADIKPISAIRLKQHFSHYLIVDFSNSQIHQSGHIPGARFAVRSSLSIGNLEDAAGGRNIVFYGSDSSLLELALADYAEGLRSRLFVLTGGLKEWMDAGGDVETGILNPFSEPNDVFVRPMELNKDREAAMRAYLDWEVDLIDRVAKDKTLMFEL